MAASSCSEEVLVKIGQGKFQYLMFIAYSSSDYLIERMFRLSFFPLNDTEFVGIWSHANIWRWIFRVYEETAAFFPVIWTTLIGGFFGSMQLLVAAFLVPQSSNFECQVDELQSAKWTRDEKRNFSLSWTTEENYSKCFYYQRNYSNFVSRTFEESVSLVSNENLTLQRCSHWIYDTEVANSTLISEFDLVCDRHNLRSLVQSVFMAGVFVSAPIGGYLADKYGRVPLIFGGFFLYLSSGIFSGFANSFEIFLVGRFVVAFSGNFVYLTAYILMLEWCLPRQRSIFGLAFSVPFAFGYMALPIVAFYVREWRLLLKVIAAFTTILGLNLFVTMESPRWLIQNGKLSKAVEAINFARTINGKPKLSGDELMKEFLPISSMSNLTSKANLVRRGCNSKHQLDEVRSPFSKFSRMSPTVLKLGLLLTVNWFVCNMVYYGLSLSAGNFGVNTFVYMFLGGLMEIPCYLLIVPFVMKYGRRIPLISFFAVCGVAVLSSLALSEEYRSLGFVVLNMFGKLNITSSFQLLYLYSSEIFPTNIRTQGVGITSMMGRLGAVLSPVITDVVGHLSWKLSILIFGCSSLLAGIITLILPETNAKSLPDTVEDLEKWNQLQKRRNIAKVKMEDLKMQAEDIECDLEPDEEKMDEGKKRGGLV